MQVDAREILYIRKNAPHGMIPTLAKNIGWSLARVRNELASLKEEYSDELIIEARRLLYVNTGLKYEQTIEA